VAASHSSKSTTIRFYGDGTPTTINAIEREAFDSYLRANNGVPPASPNALRAWRKLYADDTPVAENDTARTAFDAYVQAHGGIVPASADTLRTWHTRRASEKSTVPTA
jgi:hypothetical protein